MQIPGGPFPCPSSARCRPRTPPPGRSARLLRRRSPPATASWSISPLPRPGRRPPQPGWAWTLPRSCTSCLPHAMTTSASGLTVGASACARRLRPARRRSNSSRATRSAAAAGARRPPRRASSTRCGPSAATAREPARRPARFSPPLRRRSRRRSARASGARSSRKVLPAREGPGRGCVRPCSASAMRLDPFRGARASATPADTCSSPSPLADGRAGVAGQLIGLCSRLCESLGRSVRGARRWHVGVWSSL